MKLKYYFLSLLLFWSLVAASQARVTASVSASTVAVGEQFEITFSTNGNPQAFTPPAFNGFEVVGGPNQSSSITSVNGATTVNISVGYILVGVKEGVYQIGAATMVINGKTYRSNGLKVTVTKGNPAAQRQNAGSGGGRQPEETEGGRPADISKRLFLRAIASKTNVYQGEQISVSYKLYASVNVVGSNPDKLPDFNGFWSQDVKKDNQNIPWTVEEYNGMRYHVAVLKEVILFPERYGKLVLDPFEMTFLVRLVTPSNDPIEQFFGGGKQEDVQYKVKSAAVPILVKPLPEAGKPAGFQGAVGNYAVAATLDKSALKANEALNYTLKISGSGNLKLLKAPELTLDPNIEKYDPKVEDQITETLKGVSGSRKYDYLLIPRHEGNYTIDPLKFSYFNPNTQRYVTLSTTPFPIKVAKGAAGSEVVAYSANQQDVKTLDKDIRYIKTGNATISGERERFFGSPGYYILLAFGPLSFLAALMYRGWFRDRNKDLVVVKGRNANKVAMKHLASAKRQMDAGNRSAFYEDIYKGIYGYLSDKLNISAADLNRENISGQMESIGISKELIVELTNTLDSCEMARYAPAAAVSEQGMFDKAKKVINDIENYV
ncbi:MAG: BatD family protein [Bacteroidota bacterium]